MRHIKLCRDNQLTKLYGWSDTLNCVRWTPTRVYMEWHIKFYCDEPRKFRLWDIKLCRLLHIKLCRGKVYTLDYKIVLHIKLCLCKARHLACDTLTCVVMTHIKLCKLRKHFCSRHIKCCVIVLLNKFSWKQSRLATH